MRRKIIQGQNSEASSILEITLHCILASKIKTISFKLFLLERRVHVVNISTCLIKVGFLLLKE